jgi:hypothetical protein
MIDPILSIAISVHHNKGVYALLLGSGISRSSGIPTGWEIVHNLIEQIAHLKQESCEPDPDDWFRRTFDLEPNYSDVLDEVAKSSAERSQVLRGFFEPTEEDRREGRKRPTPAHHAIAALIARGYIRVVITTNFDRLLEQALSEIGIQPVVISSSDAVRGALPLAHAPCSIIKINGDYLDTRLRNTRGELEKYDEPMDKLLDQIFDEYGLIVSGWSADWDIALCGAIERCPARRFTTYWAQRGAVGVKAASIISLRAATVVPIVDADTFFRELDDKIAALENFTVSDPLSAQVAVSRLKRYLSDDVHRISLSDLMRTEAEKAKQAITDARFSSHTAPNTISGDSILARLRLYQAELNVLLSLAVCGAYWVKPIQFPPFLRAFRRFADQQGPEAGIVVWIKLRQYPTLLVLYGMGLAALANSNYPFLKALLYHFVKIDPYKPERHTAEVIHNMSVMERDIQKLLPAREREHTPLSNHLFMALREPLRDYLPDDDIYESTFDWFEYLLCLAHCDQQITAKELKAKESADPNFYLWGPVGRFGWKSGGRSILEETGLSSDGGVPHNISLALQAEFFGANDEPAIAKYRNIKSAFDRLVSLVRREWGVFF